jgi:hypothetical protein
LEGQVRIFITYAREDGATVAQLGADLEGSKRQVWIDRDLTGGQAWWDEILKEIRACDVYVFALSESSLASRPCLRELEYAQALGRPLLPIKVGEVSIQQAPRVIADAQVVDYVGRTPESVLALRDALDHAPPPPALPDPLPEPPPVPISYFGHYREQIGADSLPYPQQQALLIELKGHLGNEEDRDDAVDLLRALSRRQDLAQSIATEIDAVLTPVGAPPKATSEEPVVVAPIPAVGTSPTRRNKWIWVVGIVLGLGLLSLVAFAQSPLGTDSSTTVAPDTTIPDTTIPDTTIPDTTIPDTTVPETFPEVEGCPVDDQEFVMEFTEMEYGPFGDGYILIWHQTGEFSTYDPFTGGWLEYLSGPVDTWQSLLGSPFEVCVDSFTGIAYGVFLPFGSA